jgi:hypothetical protein
MHYNVVMKRAPVSFRLTAEGKQLLNELSRHLGISRTGVLEILIREKAKEQKIYLSRGK